MRSFFFVAAMTIGCSIPQTAFAQPRPSDSDPEESIGPTFELPDPNDARPSISRPAPQFPTPNYGNRSVPSTSPPPGLLAPRSSFGPQSSPAPRPLVPSSMAPSVEPIQSAGPAVVEQPIYAGPISPAPQDMPPEISPNAEKWRYEWCEGHWWYHQPSGRWSYWSAGRWVEYSASRYANTPPGLHPPAPQKRWALSRRPPPPVPAPPSGAYGPYNAPAYSPGYYGPAGGSGVY